MNREEFIDVFENWFDGQINGDVFRKEQIIKEKYAKFLDGLEIDMKLCDDILSKVSEKLEDDYKNYYRDLAVIFFDRQLEELGDEEEVFETFADGIDNLDDIWDELTFYYDGFGDVVEDYFNHCKNFCEKLEEQIVKEVCEYYDDIIEDFDHDDLCANDIENFDSFTLRLKDAIQEFTCDILNDFTNDRYIYEGVNGYTNGMNIGSRAKLTAEAKKIFGVE